MNITIFSVGTRGDVQPYLALAVGLQKAGHRVQLVAPRRFSGWIESYGVKSVGVNFDAQEAMQTPEAKAVLKSRNIIRQVQVLRRLFAVGITESNEIFWQSAQDSDYVIQSPTGSGALEMAAKREIPVSIASPVPFTPTSAYPSFFLSIRTSLGGWYNKLTHLIMQQLLWIGMGGSALNVWRQKLGLRKLNSYSDMIRFARSLNAHLLYGYSKYVLPSPSDWDDYPQVTGYWFLDKLAEWQPSTELLRFLDVGPPPVYIGFGSMGVGNAAERTRLIVEALRLSGQRGILLTGWGGIDPIPPSEIAMAVNDVPHDWLFPQMAAVVHHGGAGSTGAGIRAGVPNIIIPFAPNDQYAWRERVVNLGVGPLAPDIKHLTAQKLADAIDRAIKDSEIRQRAAMLGEKIRAENGVAKVIELIESHAESVRHHVFKE